MLFSASASPVTVDLPGILSSETFKDESVKCFGFIFEEKCIVPNNDIIRINIKVRKKLLMPHKIDTFTQRGREADSVKMIKIIVSSGY